MGGSGSGRRKGLTDTPADLPPENVPPEAPPTETPPADVPPVEADHLGQLTLEGTPPPSESTVKVRRRRTKAEMAASRGGPALTRDQVAADKMLLASAFDGTFSALAMALGDHWRLVPEVKTDSGTRPAESALLADVWQPVMERYGGKITSEAMMWLSASTVTVALVVPRVRQSVQKRSGVIGWIQAKLEARRQKRSA
jgi:hypothetical protein